MKKVFFFVALAGMLFTSCEKEVDLRDAYVGDWTAEASGAIVMTMDNEPMGESPISMQEQMSVSKVTTSGDELSINGLICKLKGKELIFEDETSTASMNGVDTHITVKRTGSAEKDKIVINETYEGTWTMTMLMMSGTISGSNVITLTR